MSLLFYLEIFEYNFCLLNKNTRKQIEIREKTHLRQERDSEISIKGYYMLERVKMQEKEMEILENEEEELSEQKD